MSKRRDKNCPFCNTTITSTQEVCLNCKPIFVKIGTYCLKCNKGFEHYKSKPTKFCSQSCKIAFNNTIVKTKITYNEIISLLNTGLSRTQIAKYLGVTNATITRKLKSTSYENFNKAKSKPNNTLDKDVFLQRSSLKHGSKYDYSKVKYVNQYNKVTIICPIHGEFKQSAKSHMNGNACSLCSCNGGFKMDIPAILYYLSINNGQAYKIGITNKTVELRFKPSDLKSIKVVKTWDYEIGKYAYEKEQSILKNYKQFKYLGPDLLSSGNTELFTKDILGLDNYNTEPLQYHHLSQIQNAGGLATWATSVDQIKQFIIANNLIQTKDEEI